MTVVAIVQVIEPKDIPHMKSEFDSTLLLII